jgi:osmoprotectant transport system substrate-binding protein
MKKFDQKWYDFYGFANTYIVAVRKEEAEKHHLKTVSDLNPYAGKYKFGVDNSWINRDVVDYEPFSKEYGFKAYALFNE